MLKSTFALMALLATALLFSFSVRAEWEPPAVPHLPEDLSGFPTSELVATSEKYRAMLPKLQTQIKAAPNALEQYPAVQHDYDIARLKLGTVLDKLITEYQLEGEAKTKLAAFSDRFKRFEADMLDPAKPEYPNFDMHVSFSFAALRVLLASNPDVEKRFVKDASAPDSTLGIYYAQLEPVSSKRDIIKSAIDARVLSKELEARLVRLDKELIKKRGDLGI